MYNMLCNWISEKQKTTNKPKNKNIEKPNYNLDSLSWQTDGVASFSASFSFSPFLLLEQQGVI